MRHRTPSEIKAFKEGFDFCHKKFCECLEVEGVKALETIRKMEIYSSGIHNAGEEPTAEKVIKSLEDQKTGHWIEMGQNRDKTHNVICSECKAGFKFRGHANSIHTKTKYKYCPHCGAKMEGE